MDRLAQMLKELRVRKGWSQEDVARKVGVSLSTVQRWEKMGGRPTLLPRKELTKLFKDSGVTETR